ncbi:Carbohydrate sulfotransferase 13, partial [Frankliniella fusca]
MTHNWKRWPFTDNEGYADLKLNQIPRCAQSTKITTSRQYTIENGYAESKCGQISSCTAHSNGLSPVVRSEMNTQNSILSKFLFAHSALKRLVSSVRSKMGTQMSVLRKLHAAQCA